MKYLKTITTLPYATPSGRIVTRPGWDSETCIFLHLPMDFSPRVPAKPTPEHVTHALSRMVRPWRSYRFATADDAASMLTAVLMALSRPALRLCPAFLADASQQGSGKTKAATSLGSLMTGEYPGVTAYSRQNSDEELKKSLLASAIEKNPFLCLDNITGTYSSPVMAAVLTGGKLTDRVLGQSRTVTAQVTALISLTGNNAQLDADLQRRTVTARIDAGDAPTQRVFTHCPVAEAAADRHAIAEAACVLWAAYFAAGSPQIVPGDAGGFAEWDRLCRQPVLWAMREGLTSALPWPELGDPAASMMKEATDPEMEALGDVLHNLHALSGSSDGHTFTSADVAEWIAAGEHDKSGPCGELRSAIVDLVGKPDLSARSLGRVLKNRRDRAVRGFKLQGRQQGNVMAWRVLVSQQRT